MTFTVTYRGKDGSLCTEAVEAAGRGDCFAQMRARGIAPLSVKEGASRRANKSRAASTKPPTKPFTINNSLFAVAIAALIAGGVGVWLMTRGGKSSAGTEAPAKTETPAPAAARPPQAKTAPAATNDVPKASGTNGTEEVLADVKPKERHDTVSIHTNNLGKVVEKWIGADGKLHMSVRYARKPVFDNASDDQLAMAVSGNGMQSIAPIPITAASEQEFLESLKKPIVINDDDPDNVKQIKEAVMEARAQMKQMIDGGMSYREALAEHQRLVNENVDTRNECMAELKRLVDEGDRSGAESYMKTMNTALEQMGIPALTMPKSREELNAARQKRRAEREAAKQGGR